MLHAGSFVNFLVRKYKTSVSKSLKYCLHVFENFKPVKTISNCFHEQIILWKKLPVCQFYANNIAVIKQNCLLKERSCKLCTVHKQPILAPLRSSLIPCSRNLLQLQCTLHLRLDQLLQLAHEIESRFDYHVKRVLWYDSGLKLSNSSNRLARGENCKFSYQGDLGEMKPLWKWKRSNPDRPQSTYLKF